MEDCFSTEATQTCMAVYNIDVLPDHNIAEYGEEREDGGEGRFAINDEEWDVIDLETISEVANPGPPFVCMCNDNDFVASVYEFLEAIRRSGAAADIGRLRRTIGRCDFRFRLLRVSFAMEREG